MSDSSAGELVLVAEEIAASELTLSVSDWPVLSSHVIKGQAVVPAVLLIEKMIEACAQKTSRDFLGFSDFKVLKGITLGSQDRFQFRVDVEGTESNFQAKLWGYSDNRWFPVASLLCEFGNREAELPDADIFTEDDKALPLLSSLYEQFLFHGDEMQGITSLRAIAGDGITGTSLASPRLQQWIPQSKLNNWFTDPLSLDVAFQLGVIWSETLLGLKSLPSGIKSYKQYSEFPKQGCEVRLRVTQQGGQQFVSDIEFVSQEKTIAKISGYLAVMKDTLEESFRENTLNLETYS